MWRLTLRDLRSHVGRYVLTFVAVAIGVAFMGGVLTLTDTITRTIHDLIADVHEGTDAWVQGRRQFDTGGSAEMAEMSDRPLIDPALTDTIAQADGVAASEPFVQGSAWVEDDEGGAHGNQQFGPPSFGASWSEVDDLNPFQLVDEAGRRSRPPAGPGEVVLDRATAHSTGYQIGDTVRFQAAKGAGEAEVVGIATFGTADSPFGASFLLFEQETAQQLLSSPGRVDGIGVVAEEGWSETEVRDSVRAELEAQLAEDRRSNLEVITGEALTDDDTQEADQQFGFVRNVLLLFAAISVGVGVFVIYTSFSFIVAQRQRQMALVRAIGATRRQTLTSILVEAATVGLLASLIGYALGLGLALLLSRIIVPDSSSLVLLPSSLLLGLGAGVLVTAVSAFLPAWRASRVPPVAAMRDVAIDTSHRSVPRVVLGGLILVGGVVGMSEGLQGGGIEVTGAGIVLVFLGLVVLGPVAARPVSLVFGQPLPVVRGVVGRMAQRNAARNPKRTASTGSALMIGLGIVTLLLVMNASIGESIENLVDERFVGDFVVDAGTGRSDSGLPGEVADELSSLDEVAAASGVRFGGAAVDGSPQGIVGVDPDSSFDLYDAGVARGDLADLDEDGIAVFQQEAEDNGWDVGDQVEAAFAETGAHSFEIAALLETQGITGTYLFSNEVFDRHLPDVGDTMIWIALADGMTPTQAQPALEAVVGPYPTAELQDLDEFKSAAKAQLDPVLAMMTALLALTILIAMIGIVNTLILSILERSRELGLTRAVGATRGQIRAAVRWEALLIAAFGLLAALGVGVMFGWVVVRSLEDEGFTGFDVPVPDLVVVTAVTGALTLLAALVPAIWAGRRQILPAIAAE